MGERRDEKTELRERTREQKALDEKTSFFVSPAAEVLGLRGTEGNAR